jgi:hypothetical protein
VITNTEKIVCEVGRWDPYDIAFIRRVSFENCEDTSFDLVLQVLLQPRPPLSAGWPDRNETVWEAVLAFRGVRNLVLTVRGPWDIQTPGFCLEDISDRQWDGVNVLVSDYEGLTQEGIRFGARKAEVRSC